MKIKSSYLYEFHHSAFPCFLLRCFKHPPRQKSADFNQWEALAQIYGHLSRENGSPQSMSSAYCESSLKVLDTRRNMPYSETFIAQGEHRNHVRSTSQSSHPKISAASFSESHDILCHFSSASDPGFFSIPALQGPAQSCSFVTFRPGHCKYTSPEYILKKQRNFGELKIQSLFKGPTALHSIHSNVIC